MKKIERVLYGLLIPMNPNATIILGVFTTLWGLWILSPFWTVFNSAPLFSRVQEFAPEWAWGSWSFIAGFLLVIALRNDHKDMVSFALGFLTWHWFIISALFWWGDWHNTGGLTYTFIGIYALWSYLNFRINFVGHTECMSRLWTKIGDLRVKIWR